MAQARHEATLAQARHAVAIAAALTPPHPSPLRRPDGSFAAGLPGSPPPPQHRHSPIATAWPNPLGAGSGGSSDASGGGGRGGGGGGGGDVGLLTPSGRSPRELLARTVVAHWTHAATARALRSWRACLPAFGTLRRTAARLVSRRVVRAFNRWVAQRGSSRVLRRAVARMRAYLAVRALSTWRGVAERRVATRDVITAVLRTLRSSTFRRCFNEWRGRAAAARAALGPIARAVAHLLHRSLSRAWGSWRVHSMVHGAPLRRLRGILATLWPGGRRRRRALNAWRSAASVRRRSVRLLGGAIEAWRGSGRRHAWRVWRESVEAARRRRLAASGLLHRWLRLGWASWVAAAAARSVAQAAQARARGVVATLRNGLFASAFGSWAAAAALRRRLLRAARALAAQTLRRAVNGWAGRATRSALATRRALRESAPR